MLLLSGHNRPAYRKVDLVEKEFFPRLRASLFSA